MLFFELVVDPNVMEKEFIIPNETEFFCLTSIFEKVIEQGVIVSFAFNPWVDIVQQYINKLSDENEDEISAKKEMQELLITLKKMQKFIDYVPERSSSNWFEAIDSLNPYIPFFAKVGKNPSDRIFTPKRLMKTDKWKTELSSTTKYAKQDNEYIEAEIKPVVYNAKLVEIIDQHFNILEERYIQTLSIISETLKHNIVNCKPRVVIHISNSRTNKIDIADDIDYLKQWQEEFKEYPFILELQVWKETQEKMHDRHIVRDENFCITLPAGTDRRVHNKSSWHVEPDHNIDAILYDHRIESSPYELVASVTSSEINIWVKGVLKKNAHLSIEEKINNVKTLKRRLVPKTT